MPNIVHELEMSLDSLIDEQMKDNPYPGREFYEAYYAERFASWLVEQFAESLNVGNDEED